MTYSDIQESREKADRDRREAFVSEVQERFLAKIPPRYRDAVEAPTQALAWIADPHDTLILIGPKGTGKTHAAWALYRRLVQSLTYEALRASRGSVRFWSLPTFLDRQRPGNEEYTSTSRASWGTVRLEGPQKIDHMTEAQFARFLILDDVGAERLTDWGREQLFVLVDHRYNQLLPTVVTTNLTPAELKNNIGDRIADRLAHNAVLITMTGRSRRAPDQVGT